MFDKSILNPFMTGTELTESLQVLPKYDESIRNKDKSIRLIALSDLYDIYIPSDMSKEIYTKYQEKKHLKSAIIEQGMFFLYCYQHYLFQL